MFPRLNQRQIEQAMRKMGIQQIEIPATEVIIKTTDKEIVITEPSVSKVNMMGQETFQISGNVHERTKKADIEISEDDIKTVSEQAKVSLDEAEEALKNAEGDIAKAILKLQSK